MNDSNVICIHICNQLIDLLEQDYQKIYKCLNGELYDEYKDIILDEMERVESIKQKLKMVFSFF